MPRFDPALLPPAPASKESRTFEAPGFPGGGLSLTMSFSQGGATSIFLSERAQALYEEFGTPHGKPVFAHGDASTIPVGRRLCETVALLMLGDTPQGGGGVPDGGRDVGALDIEVDAPWGFRDWAILSQRSPTLFAQIGAWAWDLYNKAAGHHDTASGDDAPNGSGATGAS